MKRVFVARTINQKKLETMLDVSPMTVYLWRKSTSDPLPCRSIPTKGGRHRNYFAIQEVLEWLVRNRPNLMGKMQGGMSDGQHGRIAKPNPDLAARLFA